MALDQDAGSPRFGQGPWFEEEDGFGVGAFVRHDAFARVESEPFGLVAFGEELGDVAGSHVDFEDLGVGGQSVALRMGENPWAILYVGPKGRGEVSKV